MGLALRIIAGILALIGYAPNIIFVGGLAKLTSLINDRKIDTDFSKQVAYMLEWYLAAFGLAYWAIIAITAFANGLRRSHVIFVGWLMCTSALLIYSATKWLPIIQCLNNPGNTCGLQTASGGMTTFTNSNLPFLRAIVAGEIAMAAWNFIVAIFISVADNDEDATKKDTAPANAA